MNRLEKSIFSLITFQPFFGALLTRLNITPKSDIPTACTDGRTMWVNLEWMLSLEQAGDVAYKVFVLCHETMHVALLHHLRRAGRDSRIWNMACDYVINLLLVDAGLKMPTGKNAPLYDRKYVGWTEDQVYADLIKQEQDKDQDKQSNDGDGNPSNDKQDGEGDKAEDGEGDGQGESTIPSDKSDEIGKATGGKGDMGGVIDSPAVAEGEASIENEEAEWQIAVAQSAKSASGKGDCPSWIKEIVKKASKSRVDWASEMREFTDQFKGAGDYTYQRMNRRWSWQNRLIMPSELTEDLPPFVIAIDTSASVPSEALASFSREVEALREEFKAPFHIIQCDTRIVDVDVYEEGDEYREIEYKGRGGTEFQPVFDYISNMEEQPCCLIYLTDLECYLPPEPDYPVLWITPWQVKDFYGSEAYGRIISMSGKFGRY